MVGMVKISVEASIHNPLENITRVENLTNLRQLNLINEKLDQKYQMSNTN